MAGVGLVAAVVTLLAPSRLGAEEAGGIAIRVAPTLKAAPASEAVLAIKIGPPAAIPEKSFVSLRGLPPAIAIEEGHAVGPGRWAVPLSALPALKAQIPAGVSGRSEIVISLFAIDGRKLAEARSALVIAPPELAGEKRALAERLLARGESYLANGNIMGAREFFTRTAEAGLAAGALRLGSTYDPAVLRQLKAQGVVPDVGLARKWYERARELGAAEAEKALGRLGKQ